MNIILRRFLERKIWDRQRVVIYAVRNDLYMHTVKSVLCKQDAENHHRELFYRIMC
jgi:hypothetical protein